MLIVSKLAILNFMLCFVFLVWHPKIKLSHWLEFLLMLAVIFGIGLLVKDIYTISPAGALFHATVSVLCSLFTYRIWKRESNNENK